MDFFESQDRARRKSGLLVLYFVIAVVLMIASLYAAAVAVFGFTIRGQVEAEPIHWFQPVILLTVTGITLAIIGLGSLYKIAELRSGGESVAAMLGGRRISTNTDDLAERQLLNVVEEMALASGVAVPAVYVMDNEPGINAFAAGFTPDDAVVSVNRGTLEYLTRDELQGVIAHEFSHILNGDMRFNIRLIGLLHGILLLGIIGYYLMRFSGTSGRSNRSGKGGGQLVLLGLAAFVIGYVGLFFGRLIKAAVTRQREYLADASAVQFTRNPDGIGGALKKIGGLAAGSYMDTPEAESASHMFFGSGFRRMSFSIFATHPPLDERIRRIDPRFDGRFPQVQPVRIGREPAPPPRPPKTGFPRPFKTPMGERLPLDPAVLLGAIGAPTSEHVAYSAQLIESLPGPIQVAVRDPFGARCVAFAMLLDPEAKNRQHQLSLLRDDCGDATRQETEQLFDLVAGLDKVARLPLLEMVQGTLKSLSPRQYQEFHQAVIHLVNADQKITLFEFVFQKVLLAHLDRVFSNSLPRVARYHAVSAVGGDIQVVVSALAHIGQEGRDAESAFQSAVRPLDLNLALLPRSELSLSVIDESLNRLAQCTMPVKKRFLAAATQCAAADGTISVAEAELLRAISGGMDCPVPPLLPSSTRAL